MIEKKRHGWAARFVFLLFKRNGVLEILLRLFQRILSFGLTGYLSRKKVIF